MKKPAPEVLFAQLIETSKEPITEVRHASARSKVRKIMCLMGLDDLEPSVDGFQRLYPLLDKKDQKQVQKWLRR